MSKHFPIDDAWSNKLELQALRKPQHRFGTVRPMQQQVQMLSIGRSNKWESTEMSQHSRRQPMLRHSIVTEATT